MIQQIPFRKLDAIVQEPGFVEPPAASDCAFAEKADKDFDFGHVCGSGTSRSMISSSFNWIRCSGMMDSFPRR